MTDPEVEAAASEIRRNYDLCTEAILNGDPDGFVVLSVPRHVTRPPRESQS